MKVVIQSGHINIKYNSIVSLRGSTGAPNEQELTKRIADRVSAMLRERGFEVVQTDANANDDPKITKTDFDLFLALHGDADYANDQGGGFADYPEPSTDFATKESQRICQIINDVYFKETQIVYKNRSNKNTRYYYMWKYLTPKTPCVILEMGQVQDPHDKVLLGNTELIASAIVRAICKAFNVNYEINTPPVINPTPDNSEVEALKAEVARLKEAIGQIEADMLTKLAESEVECENKLKTYKEKIIQFTNSL